MKVAKIISVQLQAVHDALEIAEEVAVVDCRVTSDLVRERIEGFGLLAPATPLDDAKLTQARAEHEVAKKDWQKIRHVQGHVSSALANLYED